MTRKYLLLTLISNPILNGDFYCCINSSCAYYNWFVNIFQSIMTLTPCPIYFFVGMTE